MGSLVGVAKRRLWCLRRELAANGRRRRAGDRKFSCVPTEAAGINDRCVRRPQLLTQARRPLWLSTCASL